MSLFLELMKFDPEKLSKLTFKILQASGIDESEASVLAEVLVWTELIGRPTQGISRLFSTHLPRFHNQLIPSPCNPTVIKQSEVIYRIEGHNGFGPYLGYIATRKAIDIAKQYGVGLVGVSQSNHFGVSSYYTNLATQEHQLALVFSNAFPKVAPYGGTEAVLGTNPFAFGAPTRSKESIMVDFSTAALAGSTLRDLIEKKQDLPANLVVDKAGNSITDYSKAYSGVLLPFGGAKGFCLGLMVEIFSGVLTGAGISHEVASFKDLSQYLNVGHLFLSIDIRKFLSLESYYNRLDFLISEIKLSKPSDEAKEISLPGENRWKNYHKNMNSGIQLDSNIAQKLSELAHSLDIDIDSFSASSFHE